MRITVKNITLIVLIIIIFSTGFFISKHFSDLKQQKLRRELSKERIKNDTLVQLSPTTYRKLVADTLTQRQLRKKVKELEIELKDPKIVEVIKFVPRTIENKVVDTVFIKDSLVNITDYYPNKKDYFVKYTATINTITQNAVSNWDFNPQEFKLGLGLNNKGMYEVITEVPEFIKITNIDVQSLPLEKSKKDNFGFLIGAGYGTNINTSEDFISLQSGIRYKKAYLLMSLTTNETINLGLTFEL